MKKITPRRIVMLLLLVVFVVSLGGLAGKLYQYKLGDQDYREAEDLVELPDLTQLPGAVSQSAGTQTGDSPAQSQEGAANEAPAAVYVDPYADALANMDFRALRQVNQDILGWIIIPNTKVSYPLVQGEDNQYYLNHTWRKYWNSVGAIFMEWKCSSDLSDFNTIIYGHRVNNRSMFGTLLNYKKLSYWQANPKIYITDDRGVHIYEIFAAYETAVRSPTFWLNVQRSEDKQALIDYGLEQSVIDTGVVPTVNDQIVTLSTCTGDGHDTRWVVQGVKWGETVEEQPEAPVSPEPDVPEASQEPEAQPPEYADVPDGAQASSAKPAEPQARPVTPGQTPADPEPEQPPQPAAPELPEPSGNETETGEDAVAPQPEVPSEPTPEEKYLEGVDWENTPPEIQKIILDQIETEYERLEKYKK